MCEFRKLWTRNLDFAIIAARSCPQVRDSDAKDSKRNRVVHLIDDFRITGENGERILVIFAAKTVSTAVR